MLKVDTGYYVKKGCRVNRGRERKKEREKERKKERKKEKKKKRKREYIS